MLTSILVDYSIGIEWVKRRRASLALTTGTQVIMVPLVSHFWPLDSTSVYKVKSELNRILTRNGIPMRTRTSNGQRYMPIVQLLVEAQVCQ